MISKLVGATLFALLLSSAANAAGISKKEAEQRCSPGMRKASAEETDSSSWRGGLNPAASGLTPMTVAGATHVTTWEAACIVRAYYPRVRIIAPITDELLIPETHRIVDGGAGGSFTDATQRMVEGRLREITGGDKTMPLLIYCHHRSCFLSYNLVLRAAHAGYTNIYWYRHGLNGWRSNEMPLSKDGPETRFYYHCYSAMVNQDRVTWYFNKVFRGSFWLRDKYEAAFNDFAMSRHGRSEDSDTLCDSYADPADAEEALEGDIYEALDKGGKVVRTSWAG